MKKLFMAVSICLMGLVLTACSSNVKGFLKDIDAKNVNFQVSSVSNDEEVIYQYYKGIVYCSKGNTEFYETIEDGEVIHYTSVDSGKTWVRTVEVYSHEYQNPISHLEADDFVEVSDDLFANQILGTNVITIELVGKDEVVLTMNHISHTYSQFGDIKLTLPKTN